jgi:hypothetical protein
VRIGTKKRERMVKLAFYKAKNGYSSKDNIWDELTGLVSYECFTCKRAFVNGGECRTKASVSPCLGFQENIK